jgi:hypothetical protein
MACRSNSCRTVGTAPSYDRQIFIEQATGFSTFCQKKLLFLLFFNSHEIKPTRVGKQSKIVLKKKVFLLTFAELHSGKR